MPKREQCEVQGSRYFVAAAALRRRDRAVQSRALRREHRAGEDLFPVGDARHVHQQTFCGRILQSGRRP